MNDSSTTPPTQAKKRGCFFYGCLTTVILVIVVGIAGFLAVNYGLKKINALIEQYTEASPATLPAVQMPKSEYDELDKRVAAFQQAVDAGKPVEPLVLTADELNALIANSPGMKGFKGKVYITIDGDQVKGQVSVPLSDLGAAPGLSKLKGRYLNGSAAMKASLDNGVLIVTMQSVQIKGQSLPESIMTQLRAQNLAQDAYRDPKNAATLRKFQSIEIKDGKIIIKARAKE